MYIPKNILKPISSWYPHEIFLAQKLFSTLEYWWLDLPRDGLPETFSKDPKSWKGLRDPSDRNPYTVGCVYTLDSIHVHGGSCLQKGKPGLVIASIPWIGAQNLGYSGFS